MCQRRRFHILFLMMGLLGFAVACDSTGDTAVIVPTETAIVPTATLLPSPKTLSPKDNKDSEEEIALLDYALSPDGKTLATYTNKRVEFYDIETMESTIFMEFEDSDYLQYGGALAFSPDGKQLALSGKYFDDPVKIWDIETHQQILTIAELPENYYVSEVDFSPSGQSLLVRNLHRKANHCEAGGEDKITLHNLNENARIFEADKCIRHPPIKFQFTQNERLFLYYGNMIGTYSIQVVNSKSGEELSHDEYDWENNGGYLGVLENGRTYLMERHFNNEDVTYLIDYETGEQLDMFVGKVALFRNRDSFIINNYDIPTPLSSQWEYWEDGTLKCIYDGIELETQIKTDDSKESFATISYGGLDSHDIEVQVWDVLNCEKIFVLPIDRYD